MLGRTSSHNCHRGATEPAAGPGPPVLASLTFAAMMGLPQEQPEGVTCARSSEPPLKPPSRSGRSLHPICKVPRKFTPVGPSTQGRALAGGLEAPVALDTWEAGAPRWDLDPFHGSLRPPHPQVPAPDAAPRPLSPARRVPCFRHESLTPESFAPTGVFQPSPFLTLTSSLNLGSSLEVGSIIVRSSFSSAEDKSQGQRLQEQQTPRGAGVGAGISSLLKQGDGPRAENLVISPARMSHTAPRPLCIKSHSPGRVGDHGNCPHPKGRRGILTPSLPPKGDTVTCYHSAGLAPHRLSSFGRICGTGPRTGA